ncbi:MAG: hypothetical protein AAGB51_09920 [Planctomycetota bacterium]
MPALPKMRTSVLARLEEQLRFGSRTALRRAIGRAEALAAEIDGDQPYPEDWLVYRVTGYRPAEPSSELVVGGDVLQDLSPLVERLCERAQLSLDEVPGALGIEELCARWNVARKSVERYRRRGLVARRVDAGGGVRRLVFTDPAVTAFERRAGAGLERAERFSRIAPAIRARIRRLAEGYRRRLRWEDAQIAARLGARFGRSADAVRRVMMEEADGGSAAPRMTLRDQEVALRATLRGIDPARVAERWVRSVRTVQRAIEAARLRVLRLLLAESGRGAGLEGAAFVSELAEPLAWVEADTDPVRLIEASRVRPEAHLARERELAQAYRSLVGAARGALLGDAPSSAVVDQAQARLRFASRINASLVRSELTVVVDAAESTLGQRLDRLRTMDTARVLVVALRAAGDAVGSFDPTAGGRLAARVGLAVSRAVTAERTWVAGSSPGRAGALAREGLVMVDWTRGLDPWQRWTEPDARFGSVLDEIGKEAAIVLRARFGLADADGRVVKPRTLDEIAEMLGTTRPWAAVAVRRAIREALDAARAREAG